MEYNFFTYEGIRYFITYEKGEKKIYKYINNKLEPLSDEELKKITDFLESDYGYTYKSERLNKIINSNSKIENKEYVVNFLTWLENALPEEAKERFYQKISTLEIEYNFDASSDKEVKISEGLNTSGGYDAEKNKIVIDKKSVIELKQLAKMFSDPNDFYFKHYSQVLLHELAHMASTNYDSKTGISLSGFDKYPSENEKDRNRGLTEGFTEFISICGVPGTVELASGYYFETCLVNQMIQIIGIDVFTKSYFNNLGIDPLKEKFNEIIKNPIMASSLFKTFELNYSLRNLDEKQSLLGNIEQVLLTYYEKKLEMLYEEGKYDEIANSLVIYENMMVTPEKLKAKKKTPDNYVGVTESLNKFNEIKNKYNMLINPTGKKRGQAC